jgi:PKD repeat protein
MVIVTRIAVLALAVTGFGLVHAGAALAATAPNDNFANATVISALPFSDVVDNTSATTEPGEPTGQCFENPQQTVWYSITPASNMTIGVDMSGSTFFDTVFDVYTQLGSGLAGLSSPITCASLDNPTTSARFQASANTTYYIQAGSSCCTRGGSLHLNVSEILPPADDNFADATVISPSQFPFTDTEDATAATTQPGEPSCGQAPNSWWYSFTPTSAESLTASDGDFGHLAVYTGSGLTNLSQVGCARSTLTFRAIAGTTYYFRVNDSEQGLIGPVTFTLDHTQPPIASFLIDSDSASTIFVPTQFSDQSTDPGQVGIQSEVWDFGDGTTGTGSGPAHQYTADGDYTVTLTVTTFDGRTATTSQIVHVSTHDVGIATLTVPARAKVGKASPITVAVSNKRYPETVQVQLYSNDNQGFFGNLVGTLTLSVPVKAGKKTTQFVFSYTFTSADATDGKVAFEAIATIQGANDALPADNIVIASTIVR